MTLAEFKTYIYRRATTNSTDYPAANTVVDLNAANRYYLSCIQDTTDNFLSTDWTTSDLSTGTATPVFDARFHELIPLRVSYQLSNDADKPRARNMFTELLQLENQFRLFYGARNFRICTITIASPGVITRKNHGIKSGDRVIFSTSGSLPTGLTANTWYWVVSNNMTVDDFCVSATKGGTPINTSSSQSGTHWFASDTIKGISASIENNR